MWEETPNHNSNGKITLARIGKHEKQTTLLRDIKKVILINGKTDIAYLWIGRLNTIKISILPRLYM